MIQEAYVSFETAKLLKEKGFDEQLCHFYTEEGLPIMYKTEKGVVWASNSKSEHAVTQPTQQMAMKWLREVHNIHCTMEIGYGSNVVYFSNIHSTKKSGVLYNETVYYKSYEEACEAAIRYCLENLI